MTYEALVLDLRKRVIELENVIGLKVPEDSRAIKDNNLSSIRKAVANYFHVGEGFLCMKCNNQEHVYPRSIAWYLSRKIIGASFPKIGLFYGGFHHTTVLHGIEKIEGLRQTDRKTEEIVLALMEELGAFSHAAD